MRSKVSSDQLLFDPEIERTTRRLNSRARRRANIAKARDNATATSSQQLETIDESQEGFFFHELFTEEEPEVFIQPTVVNMAANGPCANSPRLNPQFARTAANGRPTELKTGIIQLICASPFAGLDHEDPYTHLTRFYELAGTTGAAQADEEALFKRLFPHSLLSKAKDWYLDQPEALMTNWNTLEEKFLERFYSQNRFFEAKTAIAVFSQGSNESLNEAWEMYKAMLRKCKGHGFTDVDQIHMFRNGLTATNKTLLDATAGGSLMSKTPEEATQIIERMALNDRQSNHDRTVRDKKPGLLELTNSDALLAQNKLLTSQVELLTQQMSKLPQQSKELNGVSNSYQVAKCELCKGDHQTGFCPPVQEEQVNYMNNNQGQRQNQYQNQPYQQGYPPRYNNQGYQQRPPNQGYQQQAFQPYTQPPQQQQGGQSKLEETVNQFIQTSVINQKNQEAAIKNLQTQVGQITHQLTLKAQGALPNSTVKKPQDQEKINAVTTRSQKGLESEKEKEEIGDPMAMEVDLEIRENLKEPDVVILPMKPVEEKNKKDVEQVIKPPLPLRVTKKDSKEKDVRKFTSLFKKLEVNLPFFEALEHVPVYKKFMKEVSAKKRSLEGEPKIAIEKCSIVVAARKIPIKRKDPGAVAIPCTIKNISFKKVLLDSGSSVSLMPLSIFKRLELDKISESKSQLRFADHTIKKSYGVAEDVLVEVDKFVFPVDFHIMDIPEDEETPILLGRPFLSTGRCNLDIEKGTLTLKSFDEEVTLKMLGVKKHRSGVNEKTSTVMPEGEQEDKNLKNLQEKVSNISSPMEPNYEDVKSPKKAKESDKNGEGKVKRKDIHAFHL